MHAHSALKLLICFKFIRIFYLSVGFFSEHPNDSEKKLEKMINI